MWLLSFSAIGPDSASPELSGSVGASPSVIAYDEVYSAIQTGVIDGLENEKVVYAQMRFFEVAPHYTVNEHSITVRPLFISERTFQRFSPAVQEAIMRAGRVSNSRWPAGSWIVWWPRDSPRSTSFPKRIWMHFVSAPGRR